MPNSQVHTIATIALTAVTAVAAYYNAMPVVSVMVGGLVGVIITPDLDMDTGWWLSHLPLVGTAIRCIYLGAPVAALAYVIGLPVRLSFDLALAILTLAVVDTLHFFFDVYLPIKIVVLTQFRRGAK